MAPTGTQVFVQLGRIPPFAVTYVEQAAAMAPSFRTVLISDRKTPDLRGVSTVPLGNLVTVSDVQSLTARVAAAGFNPRFRGGYWPRIFMRFLAMERYLRAVDVDGPAVHLECDVASFASEDLIRMELMNRGEAVLIPLIDDEAACPSIIIGRSAGDLADVAGFVLERLGRKRGQSDMGLLAQSVKEGVAGRLATHPAASTFSLSVSRVGAELSDGGPSPMEKARVLFDAAAVGQYLFGIDPRNNRGVLIPGYRETRGNLDPGSWSDWHLARGEDGITRVAFRADGELGVMGALHVHAKSVVPLPSNDSSEWAEHLAIANHQRGPVARVQAKVYIRYELEETVRRSRRLMRRMHNRFVAR